MGVSCWVTSTSPLQYGLLGDSHIEREPWQQDGDRLCPRTRVRQPSSLADFLHGFLQVSGIRVRLQVQLGSRVVTEGTEQETNTGRTVTTLAGEQKP